MILAISLTLFLSFPSLSQVPQKNFKTDSLPGSYFDSLRKEFASNKQYPAELEKAVLIALSYFPELRSTHIRFEHRSNHSPGFTRVTWGGFFEPPTKRHFLIVISDSTERTLRPLIYKNLPFNAQVGLIGHELSHVADFLSMTTLEILQHGIKSISPGYIDKFERNTDMICIDHGLGYQLLSWSSYVRRKMNTLNWDGPDRVHKKKKRNRYMNPDAIQKIISSSPHYPAEN